MDPLISLELRWFLPGGLPGVVDHWFRQQLPETEISSADERADIYLSTPRQEDLGIKIRQGKLEIKWREFAKLFTGAHDTKGQVERWIKWSWENPPPPPGAKTIAAWPPPSGPWITVNKRRWQRKYRWENGIFGPVPPKEVVHLGAVVEVTALEIDGRRFGTVLIETFAPDQPTQEKLLDTAVKYLWRDYPSPRLKTDQSYGYPHWLASLVKRR